MDKQKHRQNSDRSLELVVSAPLEACIDALQSLHNGGWFKRKTVTVRVFAEHDNTARFVVKRLIPGGKIDFMLPFHGVLTYDDDRHITTVEGEIPSMNSALVVSIGIVIISIILVFTPLVQLSFMLLIFSVLPFLYWLTYATSEKTQQRLLNDVVQAIGSTEKRKHQAIDYVNDDDSPFYGEDV